MPYDGSIKIKTTLDDKEAEKKLLKLETDIAKLQDQVFKSESKRSGIAEGLEQARAKAREAEAAVRELREVYRANKSEYAAMGSPAGEDAKIYKQVQAEITRELGIQERVLAQQNAQVSKLEAEQAAVSGTISDQRGRMAALREEHERVNAALARQSMQEWPRVREQAQSSIDNVSAGMKRGLMSMLRYGAGIQTVYMLFRHVRSALIDGIKQYAQYDAETQASINNLRSALNGLKGSFVSAFAPIVNAVVPYLVQFISWIAKAVDAVAMFFAILGGKKTYKRAVAGLGSTAEGLGATAAAASDVGAAAKEAKRQLSGLDEITTWDSGSSGGGGRTGGGGGGGGGSSSGGGLSWEEVPVDADSFTGKLALTFKDVLFNWSNLTGAQIAQKVIAGLGALAGAVAGFAIGGVPGAIVGTLLGGTLSIVFDTIVFDIKEDPEVNDAEFEAELDAYMQEAQAKADAAVQKKGNISFDAKSTASALRREFKEKLIDELSETVSVPIKTEPALSVVVPPVAHKEFKEKLIDEMSDVTVNVPVTVTSDVVVKIKEKILAKTSEIETQAKEAAEIIKTKFHDVFSSGTSFDDELDAYLKDTQAKADAATQANTNAPAVATTVLKNLLALTALGAAGGLASPLVASGGLASALSGGAYAIPVTAEITDFNEREGIRKITEGWEAQLQKGTDNIPLKDKVLCGLRGLLESASPTRSTIADPVPTRGDIIKAEKAASYDPNKALVPVGGKITRVEDWLLDKDRVIKDTKALISSSDFSDNFKTPIANTKANINAFNSWKDGTINWGYYPLANTKAMFNAFDSESGGKIKWVGSIAPLANVTASFNDYQKYSDGSVYGISGMWQYAQARFNDYQKYSDGSVYGVTGLWQYAKAWFNNYGKNSNGSVSGISGMWAYLTAYFNEAYASINGVWKKLTGRASGGVFAGGRWRDIASYAAGGRPNMGQLFVAREAGPELVGTLGGHTAVMNNDQIVASVAAGVARAIAGIKFYAKQPSPPVITPEMIPAVARGQVIPPNILDLQEDIGAIRASLERLSAQLAGLSGQRGGRYTFNAQINRRTVFSEMIEEAKLQRDMTGINPFALG